MSSFLQGIDLPIPAELDVTALTDAVIAQGLDRALAHFDSQGNDDKSSRMRENAVVLRELMREWISDAADRQRRLRDAPDWRLLVSLVSAFCREVEEGREVVERVLQDLSAVSLVERSISQARERLVATLPPTASAPPDAANSSSSRNQDPSSSRNQDPSSSRNRDSSSSRNKIAERERPRTIHADRNQAPKESSSGPIRTGRAPFNAHDPSMKVPPAMEDDLRQRAVRYAKDLVAVSR